MKKKASLELRSMRIKAMELPAGGNPSMFGVTITRFIDGVPVQAHGDWLTRITRDGPVRTGRVRWFIDCKRSSWAKVVARFRGACVSPDQINKQWGKPSWTCFGCKAESGLHWWNGLSVAVCQKPECSKAYGDLISRQAAEEQAYQDHVKENQWWPN